MICDINQPLGSDKL